MVGKDQDRAPFVTIKNNFVNTADPDLDIELFPHLTAESLFGAFAGVNLATREFPETRMALVIRPPGQQNFFAIKHHGSRNQ